METMQQQRERRNELAREARNLNDTVKATDWKPEEHGKRFDELTAEIERIDASIAREQKILDMSAERSFREAGVEVPADSDEAMHRALDNKWLRKGDAGLTAEEWAIKNTMSTTTDSQGGYTVQKDIASNIIEALKAYGGVRDVATVLLTAKGNPMAFPTSDYTSEEGEVVGQNADVSDLDPSFGTKPLDVFKYSSKMIKVPIELLQDSETDIEAFLTRVIASRLGRITNKHFTIGAGTTVPTGVAYAAGGRTGKPLGASRTAFARAHRRF